MTRARLGRFTLNVYGHLPPGMQDEAVGCSGWRGHKRGRRWQAMDSASSLRNKNRDGPPLAADSEVVLDVEGSANTGLEVGV